MEMLPESVGHTCAHICETGPLRTESQSKVPLRFVWWWWCSCDAGVRLWVVHGATDLGLTSVLAGLQIGSQRFARFRVPGSM